jgi:hypothetical protein
MTQNNINENEYIMNEQPEPTIIIIYKNKYPPSKQKYIKKYHVEHPEKLKEIRQRYYNKCFMNEEWKQKRSEQAKKAYKLKKEKQHEQTEQQLNN